MNKECAYCGKPMGNSLHQLKGISVHTHCENLWKLKKSPVIAEAKVEETKCLSNNFNLPPEQILELLKLKPIDLSQLVNFDLSNEQLEKYGLINLEQLEKFIEPFMKRIMKLTKLTAPEQEEIKEAIKDGIISLRNEKKKKDKSRISMRVYLNDKQLFEGMDLRIGGDKPELILAVVEILLSFYNKAYKTKPNEEEVAKMIETIVKGDAHGQ